MISGVMLVLTLVELVALYVWQFHSATALGHYLVCWLWGGVVLTFASGYICLFMARWVKDLRFKPRNPWDEWDLAFRVLLAGCVAASGLNALSVLMLASMTFAVVVHALCSLQAPSLIATSALPGWVTSQAPKHQAAAKATAQTPTQVWWRTPS